MMVNEDSSESRLDGEYPRPQLRRARWQNLNGEWSFAYDHDDVGVDERWWLEPAPLKTSIQVPFPPGSPLSDVVERDCDVVWYARRIRIAHAPAEGERVLLHFEAVDHEADIWVNGRHLAHHIGGYTPICVDMTPVLDGDEALVVVRARDERLGIDQPRGKQDWRPEPHGIWYRRSTGIWRDVWTETVPGLSVESIVWGSDLTSGTISCSIALRGRPRGRVSVVVGDPDAPLALASAAIDSSQVDLILDVPALRNRLEWDALLWSPDHPTLFDARIDLIGDAGEDHVISYLGIREVDVASGYLRINGEPVYVRAVLDQGYWEESYFTAPSSDHLRLDLECAQSLGFNTVRVHQRTPDRRYLAWADRLGIMVWSEFASAFAFSRTAVDQFISGWNEIVLRDSSHPSIVVWVPFNESWGVPGVVNDPRQQAFVDAAVALTRALDGSRPVIANDGWEQLDTDIITIHDYGTTGVQLLVNYSDESAVVRTVEGIGPQGRAILLRGQCDERPIMVSEFGGIALNRSGTGAWGYGVVEDQHALEERVSQLFDALYRSPALSGVCYTQLTDTAQEANGLCWPDRSPKIPADRIRAFVNPTARLDEQIRPRTIREVSTQEEE
ncbi:sugar-binding domain-containing protein [Schaalia hyovaginalis]|uniref:glycoside hydrolase family 2 protein n=1 Tax=Schaalia hyovaginalis TaxID=29316 RepID=UPI002A764AAD|nr:sugar-binding domain-containing protein [Schaalia hyovaginalis]MDY2669656.1 glycoside hydrolase family 2 TIM barrel-domain containing protein [Schaalia hyovaginalis]